MASPKQLKNVYTILEKVKKGEIETHYKAKDEGGGLFGKIDFYKKPDLIKPYLHYIDDYRLQSIFDVYMNDPKVGTENYQKFVKTTEFKKLDSDKQPDSSKFFEKFKENYKKFPKHIGKDIFKMYYNNIGELDFEERTDKNAIKYKILETSNNPVGKVMSNTSNLKSAVFARNVLGYFITRMTMMDYIDPDTSNDMQSGMNGEQGGNDPSDAFDKMFSNKIGKQMLEDAIQQAQETCQKLDETMSDEMQEEMFVNAENSGEASKLNPNFLRDTVAKLEKINLSMGPLKDKIKKLLDNSVSYFSAKKETIYEDLFNSDNVAGLEEYELLHPRIRKAFMEDIVVKNTKAIGKIDLYIDISGSMSSGCGTRNLNGDHISKLDFCKAFAAKLKQYDMLNNVFVFNAKVKKIKNDIFSISMLRPDGGTSINAAIYNVQKEDVNAILITDAEDGCHTYCDKAYFIGVEGASFHHFKPDVIEQYSKKSQVVVFDGVKIYNVGKNGSV